MKFVLLFLLVATTICAQISDPLEIAPEFGYKYYTGQRSYKIHNDEVYITYKWYNDNIYFTKINAENEQITTLVDSLQYQVTKPAIEVMDNGNIIIVYSEIVDYEIGYLQRALSTDGGETFEILGYQIDAKGEPHIVKRDNSLDICYPFVYDHEIISLAELSYYTVYEESENADGGPSAGLVAFWGADVLYGPVHSNDDIWIQNGGGGNNGGWPTFYGMVTTSGRLRDYNSGGAYFQAPPGVMEEIFLGGYEEEVPTYEALGTNDIIANGIALGNENTDIVYINMHDGSFDIKLGVIVEQEVVDFDVYSWFPHTTALVNAVIDLGGNWYEDSDLIFTNEITIYDTIWEDASSYPLNNSFWIPHGELWIQGEVSGSTTFGCADTIYIVGDITYQNTPVGSWPDGFSGIDPVTGELLYNGPVNSTDYFGLVSDSRIYIKYKHTAPINDADPPVISVNGAGANGDGHVYLYGAYAALGIGDISQHGDMACHYDGIFSFEYQHPHGSTPNFIAPSPYIREEFSIILSDTGNNGWDGATMDVIVDGNLIWDDIYCIGSQSTFEFDVDNGDWLETEYSVGGSDDENSYVIYDHHGNAVAGDGPSPDPDGIEPYHALINTRIDTLYKFIDLHKFIFPIQPYVPPEIYGFNLHGGASIVNSTCGFPYEDPVYINSYPNNNSANYAIPYGTDYPWYNPVWPETSNDIVPFERGSIHLYGSIAQTRRGFIHRSGGDPYNHPPYGPDPYEWDLSEFHFNGTHGHCGYDKNYYSDIRFETNQPPDFPLAIVAPEIPRNIKVLHSVDGGEYFAPVYEEIVEHTIKRIWMDSDEESVLIAYEIEFEPDVFHFLISNDDPENYTHYTVENYGNSLVNAHIIGDDIYVLAETSQQNVILRYEIGDPIPYVIQAFSPEYHLCDFTVNKEGILAYVQEVNATMHYFDLAFHYDIEAGSLMGLQNWQYDIPYFCHEESNISIQLDENGKVYTTILIDNHENNSQYGDLYLISGELEGIMKSQEIEFIPTKTSLQIFPNPFNPSTTISFSLNTENTENAEIVIYNIKGQKVNQLGILNYELGVNEVVWQGTDMNNKAVASGIYLFQLKADNKILKTRKGLLLK